MCVCVCFVRLHLSGLISEAFIWFHVTSCCCPEWLWLTSCQLQCFCVCLSPSHLFSFVLLRRLPVQTVSHEPLLGPKAVLESGEAWREHRRRAPQQAACEQSDDMCTSVASSQAPLHSFTCVGGVSQTKEKQHLLLRTLPVEGVHGLPFCLLHPPFLLHCSSI